MVDPQGSTVQPPRLDPGTGSYTGAVIYPTNPPGVIAKKPNGTTKARVTTGQSGAYGAYVQLSANFSGDIYGLVFWVEDTAMREMTVQLATGASGSETVIGTFPLGLCFGTTAASANGDARIINLPGTISVSGLRLAARFSCATANGPFCDIIALYLA